LLLVKLDHKNQTVALGRPSQIWQINNNKSPNIQRRGKKIKLTECDIWILSRVRKFDICSHKKTPQGLAQQKEFPRLGNLLFWLGRILGQSFRRVLWATQWVPIGNPG
jgi:hypothetical protein